MRGPNDPAGARHVTFDIFLTAREGFSNKILRKIASSALWVASQHG
jgi:hypothetical protein